MQQQAKQLYNIEYGGQAALSIKIYGRQLTTYTIGLRS